MLFQEYKELTKRTLPDLGSSMLNSVHMSMGFASETYELFEAIANKDKANLGEEIGDKLWYVANYININELNVEFEFSTTQKPIFSKSFGTETTGALFIELESELLDYDKKWLAYGKQKDLAKSKQLIENLLVVYNNLILEEKLDASIIISRNIAKLLIRFPEKFEQDKALIRNLGLERQVLEGNQ